MASQTYIKACEEYVETITVNKHLTVGGSFIYRAHSVSSISLQVRQQTSPVLIASTILLHAARLNI